MTLEEANKDYRGNAFPFAGPAMPYVVETWAGPDCGWNVMASFCFEEDARTFIDLVGSQTYTRYRLLGDEQEETIDSTG